MRLFRQIMQGGSSTAWADSRRMVDVLHGAGYSMDNGSCIRCWNPTRRLEVRPQLTAPTARCETVAGVGLWHVEKRDLRHQLLRSAHALLSFADYSANRKYCEDAIEINRDSRNVLVPVVFRCF